MNFRIHAPVTRPLPAKPRATAPFQAPQKPAAASRQTRPLATSQEFQRTGPSAAPVDLESMADFRALRDQGRLTPEAIAQLRILATRPLAEGIDRKALIATALQEIADPERIGQGDRHTCAAAVVQAKLAQDDPAEYLRLLSGLASPDGEVTLANGETMRRDPNWRLAAGRSITGDLMQPAFMQVATGSYDSRTDTRATSDGSGKGLYAAEQTRLLDAVTGSKSATVFGNGPRVIETLQEALAQGHTVPVVLMIRDRKTGELQGHSVLVESIQDGQVTFLDPNGRRRSVSLEAFTSRLQSASLPAGLVPVSLLEASEGQVGVLAGFDLWGAVSGGFKAAGDALVEHVAKPVVDTIKGGAQAFTEHVIQPAARTIDQVIIQPAARAIDQVLIQPVKTVLTPFAPCGEWLMANVLVPFCEHLLFPAWEFVKSNAKSLKKAIEDHQESLRTIAAIACAVTPGLNVLSLVLAVGEIVDGAKQIAEGLRTGNWKTTFAGVAQLLGGVATAIGGPLLSAAIGKGAAAMARLATGVSKLASATSTLLELWNDELSTADKFGKLFGVVISAVGGRASLIGEEAEKAAQGFLDTARKAQGYYDKSVGLYKSILKGDAWNQTASLGLGLAADIQGDVRGNDAASRRLGHQVREGAHVLNQAPGLVEDLTRPAGQAIRNGAPDRTDVDVVADFLALGNRVAHDVRTDWSPDAPQPEKDKHLTDPVAHLAELWRESKGLAVADPLAQVQAAWAYFKKAGKTRSDDEVTQWLRGWTSDMESWAANKEDAAKAWARTQVEAAWTWWSEQRQAVPAS